MDLTQAQEWLQELGKNESTHRQAVTFAGAIGMPVLVPWLMNMMTVPELARKAGESFVNITGADLVDNELAGDEPEGFEAGPTENPDDEMVAMDADEDLPWPNIDAIARWWAENQNRFAPHERFLLGQPVASEALHSVLMHGKQTNRHAAALEMALRVPGQPLVEVRARNIS
jgi:uncharacterized protein (TIGR02270 family)